MREVIISTESLHLPSFAADKIGSRKVLVKEVTEGILLSPVKTAPALRGKYKGVLSSEDFLAQKQGDKELEE